MINKYDQYSISTETLIKTIQETTVRLKSKAEDITPNAMNRHLRELSEMKSAVRSRLDKMDRTKPEFFPVGCYVEYSFPYSQAGPKNAVVVAHLEHHVAIRLEGEVHPIQAEPRYLSIKFLRERT